MKASYVLAVEVFGDFVWERAEASELSVGTVASLALRAAFADYTSYGMDGGMRYRFVPGARGAPYVSGLARRVEAIPGRFSVPAAGVTLPDIPFFDGSTVPVFGVLFAVSPRVSLGVEAGVRYHTDLSNIDGLAGTGLENLNDAGSRWSVPISGVVRFGILMARVERGPQAEQATPADTRRGWLQSVATRPHRTMTCLRYEMVVPAPLEATFAFFSDASNLQRLTPGWVQFSIVTPLPIVMRAGLDIDYWIRLYGVPLAWTSRIDVWEPGHRFVDRQIAGPYGGGATSTGLRPPAAPRV